MSHVMSEHGKGGVDVFSIRKQDLCLSTGSLCHKGSEKSHPAWIALLALFNFFFHASWGSVHRRFEISQIILELPIFSIRTVRVTSFLLAIVIFVGKIFGIFAEAFRWSNRQSSTLNDAFEKVRQA